MLAMNWFTWELMVIISGYIGVNEQAATVIVMNLVGLLYAFGSGFDGAACALIGQQIGKGNLLKAKQYFQTLCITTITLLIQYTLFFFTMRHTILSVFTRDEELIKLASNVTWIICLSNLPDSFKGMMQGVIRALGIQKRAFYINIMGHGILNLSLQYLFVFKLDLGMRGMWYSKLCLELFIFLG